MTHTSRPIVSLVFGIVACGGTTSTSTGDGSTTSPLDGGANPSALDASSDAALVDAALPSSLDCVLSTKSDLVGVSVSWVGPRCVFTLAEAKSGIQIDYDVVVDREIGGVVPAGQTSAPRVGPSGLDIGERLSGGGQSYCVCDVGLGVGLPTTPTTLHAGTSRGSFKWDGHNWSGPSDTGNPKGALFPAGDYELEVHTNGTKDGVAFSVSSKFLVRLVP